jgi:hypothetical protein
MLVYVWDSRLEQFRHGPLRQPDAIAFEPHLNPGGSITRLIEDYLTGRFGGWNWEVLGHVGCRPGLV